MSMGVRYVDEAHTHMGNLRHQIFQVRFQWWIHAGVEARALPFSEICLLIEAK